MKHLTNIPECIDCVRQVSNIFSHLRPEELSYLDDQKNCSFHKRGTILYHEGNRTNGCYCINKGIVKLYKTGTEGKEQIIKFAKRGDIIGYRSLLSGEPACTTAKVIEDSSLCYIPSDFLVKSVKNNSAFSLDLMQLACKELGDANNYITDIAQKSVRERLAEILVLLSKEFGTEDDGTLLISLTREEMANIVGTATESVIRLLSEFKADKYIEINGRKIKLLNVARLKKVANLFD